MPLRSLPIPCVLACCLLLALASQQAQAQDRKSCASSSTPAYQAVHNADANGYQKYFDKMNKAGYTLTVTSFYTVSGALRYASLWKKLPKSEWSAVHGLTSADYQKAFDTNSKAKRWPAFVNGYTDGAGVNRFTAKFVPAPAAAWYAFHDLTLDQLNEKVTWAFRNSYCPTWVSGYGSVANGGSRYTLLLTQYNCPRAWQVWVDLDAGAYQGKFNTFVGQGMRLDVVNAYSYNGATRYAGIWSSRAGGAFLARHNVLGWQAYQCEFDNQLTSGWVLQHVSGCGWSTDSAYAAIWTLDPAWQYSDVSAIDTRVSSYLSKWSSGISAVSLALANAGRLVYAKGYGSQDPSTGQAMCSNTRMRIASISKPVTSTALHRLMEMQTTKIRRLSYSAKVFGPSGLLSDGIYTNAASGLSAAARAILYNITVQNVLEHAAGGHQWDNNRDPNTMVDPWWDPMFQSDYLSYSQSQVIEHVLSERPLTTTPGTLYEYSNFGYMVLGRVIEKLTGKTYASWVKDNVLSKCGVTGMDIAGDTLAARKANEAVYMANPSDVSPYALKVARMDSHGGWIASAADLVRFGTCIDGYAGRTDVLKAASLTAMTTITTAKTNAGTPSAYAKGLVINSNSWFHDGSLPGSVSLLNISRSASTTNQWTWAIIANGRPDGQALSDLYSLGRDIVASLNGPMPCNGLP